MEKRRPEERLAALKRVHECWVAGRPSGNERGEMEMRALLALLEEEARGEADLLAVEEQAAVVANTVAVNGGLEGALGQKIMGLIDYLGSPPGDPEAEGAFEYYFFRDLCEHLCGVQSGKRFADFGRSLAQIRAGRPEIGRRQADREFLAGGGELAPAI